jgi:DNA-binding CsgD family transcriptional regulator/predicted transcriptional regulator
MSNDDTLMTALGLSRVAGRLYERLVHQSGKSLADIAASLDLGPGLLSERLEPLVELGVVAVVEERVLVTPPAEAVGRMISQTAAEAARAQQRLQEIAAAMPYLAGASTRIAPDIVREREPIDGELALGTLGAEHFRAVIGQGVGDIMLLRPDQWALPYEDELAEPIGQAIRAGRRCRAIYPVRALSEATGTLHHRAAMGEEIRLLPELPTRLIVLDGTHAVLPEPLGFAASPRVVVRQRGIVELATLYFEQLWRQAAPLDQPAMEHADQRRFLLEQLASGAQDEQIARRLGLSLRTVRRRVADVMTELGASSRFQAGVEAARRGWL